MTKPVQIVLVEDDIVDVEAVRRALRKQRIANPIVRFSDGIEALRGLRGEGDATVERPCLILLDLNMPRMNGLEFLAEMRADPLLRDNLVFVLTTSEEDRDVSAAYQMNVAGYLVKSRAGEDFIKVLNLLEHYWRIVEFPMEEPA